MYRMYVVGKLSKSETTSYGYTSLFLLNYQYIIDLLYVTIYLHP